MNGTDALPPIDLEAIRREIQRRHLIAIEPTDPVLTVASMIEIVSEHSLARFLAVLDKALDRQHQAAIQAGERIVNQGADHLVETVQAAVAEATAAAVGAFKGAGTELPGIIAAGLDEQRRLLAQTRSAAMWAWIGAGGLILAGVVAIGVTVGRLL